MTSKIVTISINANREKRALCNRVKTIGLNSNGILFGGVVRDDIIGKHYRSHFLRRNLDTDKYWDPNYDEETKHRLIIPNDIDIFFRSENNSLVFQNRLREFVRIFNGTINIIDDVHFRNFDYSEMNQFLKHKVITLTLRVGRTLFESGVRITLKIDLIEINNSNQNNFNHPEFAGFASSIEPPFNNLDFLSNVFIMECSSYGGYSTRLSNSTGTPIDYMTFSEKTKVSAMIIDDMINFRTKFVRNVTGYSSEYVNCFRILKMICKPIPWNISNLPFKIMHIDEVSHEIDDNCCICLQDIHTEGEGLQVVQLNTYKEKSRYLHKDCFIEYLQKEQHHKYVDQETEVIQCRCPFRGFFKFGECYKNVNYI